MKRIIITLSAVIMLLFAAGFVSESAMAATTLYISGDTSVRLDTTAGTLTISGSGRMSDYTSLSKPGWYNSRGYVKSIIVEEGVTYIGDYCLYGLTQTTSITLPSTLTSIGDYAFANASKAVDVVLPESVTSIAYTAFSNSAVNATASGTTGEVSWSLSNKTFTVSGNGRMADYTSSPWSTFRLSNLIESIVIEPGVTHIGNMAFYVSTSYIDDVTSISIANTVESIGAYAFHGSREITSVSIPGSVKSIGNYAFYYCNALTSVNLSEGLETIGSYAFGSTKLASLNLPSTVTTIGSSAFYGVSTIKSVTLPEGILAIGSNAFYNTGITSVSVPSTIQSLGSGAFPSNITFDTFNGNYNNGEMIWSISNGVLTVNAERIPDFASDRPAPWRGMSKSFTALTLNNVSYIGNYAFNDLSGVTEASLPNTLTEIGDYAFSYTSITTIEIPSTVTSIGDFAFYTSDLTAVTIPGSVKTIGRDAFGRCSSLASVTLEEGISYIGFYAFYDCNSLKTLTVPESVTDIGGKIANPQYTTVTSGLHALGSVGELTWKIKGSTIYISGSGAMPAFDHETSSKYNIDTVDTPWWDYRNKLSAVVIGEGVTSISNAAFYKCINITSASLPSTLTSIGTEAFESTSLKSIDVPDSVTYIGTYAFCQTDLTEFRYPAGVTTMSGLNACSSLERVTVAENANITSITEYNFSGCRSLKEITIPETVTKIGSCAFNYSSLETIVIPESVTSFGTDIFRNCTSLTSVTLPGSMASIPDYMFSGCTALTDITIPGSVTSIGKYAFSTTGLVSVDIPDSVTSIGTYAFNACAALGEVSLPAGITSVPSYCFYNCTGLTSISFPESIATIETYAFYGCSSLNNVVFHANIKTIGSLAFGACRGITGIEFEGEAPTIASNSFSSVTAAVTYFPYDSWTGKIQNYGGTLTWLKKSGSCGEYTVWQYETARILRINGTGAVDSATWTDNCSDVTMLVFGYDVTSINVAIAETLPNVNIIVFEGQAPTVSGSTFSGINAQAYYYHGIPTWTAGSCAALGEGLIWDIACARSGEAVTVANVTEVAEVPADCENDGTAAHVLCACGKMFTDTELHTGITAEELVLTATGHLYGEPVFVWAEDGSACEASVTCFNCGDVQTPEVTLTFEEGETPNCTDPGSTIYTASILWQEITYTDVLTLFDISATGHAEVIFEGFEPTCTEPGLTDEVFCEICGESIKTAEEIPALGHAPYVTIEALAATCTESGNTEEVSCSACGIVLTGSETIPALGHAYGECAFTWADDNSCTGSFTCAACGDVQTIDAVVNAMVTLEPNCTEMGETTYTAYVVFEDTEYSNVRTLVDVDPLGHSPVTDEAVPPTNTESGLTEGSHCGVCGAVLAAQEEIPALFTYDGDTIIAYNGTATEIVIPDNATALGSTLFKNSTSVTSIVVPDNITAVGSQTFYGCTALEDIYLPDDVTGITVQTFYKVTGRIHASVGSPTAILMSYRSVPFYADNGYTLRYRVTSAAGTPSGVWIAGCDISDESIVIPADFDGTPVTQIQANAFADLASLSRVTVPDSVTVIDAAAFTGCSDDLVIVSSAEAYARTFAAANGYKWEHDAHDVVIDEGYAATCTENGLTDGSHCESCGSVIVAQEVIPTAGHTVVIDEEVPATHLTTGLSEGSHCDVCGEILTEREELPMVEVTVACMPAEVTVIEDEAFRNSDFACIRLSEGCIEIGAYSFADCAELQFIEIPASVTAIDATAFSGTDVVIITTAGSAAEEFAAENGLRCVIIEPETIE